MIDASAAFSYGYDPIMFLHRCFSASAAIQTPDTLGSDEHIYLTQGAKLCVLPTLVFIQLQSH